MWTMFYVNISPTMLNTNAPERATEDQKVTSFYM